MLIVRLVLLLLVVIAIERIYKWIKKASINKPIQDKVEEMEATIDAAESIDSKTVKKFEKSQTKINSLEEKNE